MMGMRRGLGFYGYYCTYSCTPYYTIYKLSLLARTPLVLCTRVGGVITCSDV